MSSSSDQSRTTTAGEILDRSKQPNRERRGGLAGLAGTMGNDELMARIEQGNCTRDELLDLLVGRLGTIRDAQLAEIDLTNRNDNTFRTTLGDSLVNGEPKPRRWMESARLYEDAAHALCSGQLHRGQELMEKALRAERQAFEAVSGLARFDERLATEDNAAENTALPGVSADVACTSRDAPEGLDLADAIQRVAIDGHTAIKGQRRELDPWWTDLEEEEEEEEGGE